MSLCASHLAFDNGSSGQQPAGIQHWLVTCGALRVLELPNMQCVGCCAPQVRLASCCLRGCCWHNPWPTYVLLTCAPAVLACASCRHHAQIQLGGVPDVMRWGAGGPTAKMGKDLEKAVSPAEAVAVVAAFINKTS